MLHVHQLTDRIVARIHLYILYRHISLSDCPKYWLGRRRCT